MRAIVIADFQLLDSDVLLYWIALCVCVCLSVPHIHSPYSDYKMNRKLANNFYISFGTMNMSFEYHLHANGNVRDRSHKKKKMKQINCKSNTTCWKKYLWTMCLIAWQQSNASKLLFLFSGKIIYIFDSNWFYFCLFCPYFVAVAVAMPYMHVLSNLMNIECKNRPEIKIVCAKAYTYENTSPKAINIGFPNSYSCTLQFERTRLHM